MADTIPPQKGRLRQIVASVWRPTTCTAAKRRCASIARATAKTDGSLEWGAEKAAGSLKIGNSSGNARTKNDDIDIFDVPSEDEIVVRAKPTKKLVTKHGRPKKTCPVHN
ncbi:hypothetical protein L13192_12760 [Pyrenophora tritici-repentis]|nr:hypothetical protein L13192_12760 [Pyrenophora tritici-repentis]